MKRLCRGIFVASALAFGLAACGGDEASTAEETAGQTTSETLTEQEFLQRADEICVEGDRQVDQAASEVFRQGERPSPEDTERFVSDGLVPGVQEQITGIRHLTPPPELEDEVNQFLEEAQRALVEVEQNPTLLTREGEEGPFARTEELAREVGLEECAQ